MVKYDFVENVSLKLNWFLSIKTNSFIVLNYRSMKIANKKYGHLPSR